MSSPLIVPELVQQRALANGRAGYDWLEQLPDVVAALASKWGLTVGRSFEGGTAGLVISVTDAADRQCALKVAMPLDMDDVESFRRSVITHGLAGGRGCALLYAHDDEMAAMLMERLGDNLAHLAMPIPRVLEVIAGTLRTFWRPVPADCGLPSAGDKAEWLVEYITRTWSELDKPCSLEVIERAVQYCGDRSSAFDPANAVLVHGDAHGWNTLDAGDGTFKFVDPEGVRSEPAHDLSVPIREYNGPLIAGDTARLVRERAELLAGWCDVDPEAVWQWGFIERVSTGLANMRDFDNDDGAIFLEVATRCL